MKLKEALNKLANPKYRTLGDFEEQIYLLEKLCYALVLGLAVAFIVIMVLVFKLIA